MRRLLAAAVLASVAFAAPHAALAIDYPEPTVPTQFLMGTPPSAARQTVPEVSTMLPATGVTGADATAQRQTAGVDPSYVPLNQWDELASGCGYWDWNTC